MVRTEPTTTALGASEAGGPRWTARLALLTALAALPLVVFGGLVTTLRAGMAIDGWLVLEPGRGDHFLLFYPAEKWFRDLGTFTEHTHRLFGTLVGALAVATVIAALVENAGRARWSSLAALLGVCAQGLLGGLRVLEASSKLAFVHGALAQAVFALLAINALLASRAWRESALRASASSERRELVPALGAPAPVLLIAVLATIFVGAWTRHSGSHLALAAHIALVALVVPVALTLAGRLRAASAAAGGALGARLGRARLGLLALLGAQFLLGILAAVGVFVFSGGFEGAVSTGELVFATLHVLVGALLLAQCAAIQCWSTRTGAPAARASTRADEAGAVAAAMGGRLSS